MEMQFGKMNVERLKYGATIMLASAAVGSLLGCGSDTCSVEATAPNMITGNDEDCDGIADSIDRFPQIKEGNDVDGDGFHNNVDPAPYDKGVIRNGNIIPTPNKNGSTPTPSSSPRTTPNPSPSPHPGSSVNPNCRPGLKPDGDGDGIPDACDTDFDPYVKDTDGDGIPDHIDTYPNDPNSNNNGRDDGNDPNYDPQNP